MDDDPREILALLNSLGFIGITAQQLKAFMKDLKLYRKMKDREKQERKEEIRKKIIDKQQSMIMEILREQRSEIHVTENTVSSNSSSSYVNGSHVKVRVKCLPSEKENKNIINSRGKYTDMWHKLDTVNQSCKPRKILEDDTLKSANVPCYEEDKKYYIQNKRSAEYLKKESIEKQNKTAMENEKVSKDKTPLQSAHPMSAPNILAYRHDQIGSNQTKSTASTKNTCSGTKSFIRPWRLQPDAHKNLNMKKCDPVSLYQKYQKEWKQISFPGEAKHASLRWAIREKMLGGDPHPMPLAKKSSSLPTLRRK